MGHSEMLLAVAGLKPDEIKKRTRKLAEGDWSDYAPAERQALQFAHKLSTKPAALTEREMKELAKTFGRHQAIDLIWYGAWCNYMTRVADAFQLPLEKTNVFAPPAKDRARSKEKAR
jgi:alkylhydroperoxidase family enzyme